MRPSNPANLIKKPCHPARRAASPNGARGTNISGNWFSDGKKYTSCVTSGGSAGSRSASSLTSACDREHPTPEPARWYPSRAEPRPAVHRRSCSFSLRGAHFARPQNAVALKSCAASQRPARRISVLIATLGTVRPDLCCPAFAKCDDRSHLSHSQVQT